MTVVHRDILTDIEKMKPELTKYLDGPFNKSTGFYWAGNSFDVRIDTNKVFVDDWKRVLIVQGELTLDYDFVINASAIVKSISQIADTYGAGVVLAGTAQNRYVMAASMMPNVKPLSTGLMRYILETQ